MSASKGVWPESSDRDTRRPSAERSSQSQMCEESWSEVDGCL